MGIWREIAKAMLDKKAFEQAERNQQAYNQNRYPRPAPRYYRQANKQADQDAAAWWGMEKRFDQIRTDWNDMQQYQRNGPSQRGCYCRDPDCPYKN